MATRRSSTSSRKVAGSKLKRGSKTTARRAEKKTRIWTQQGVALGWIPDLPDHRDFKYGVQRLRMEQPVTLPPKVDLRPQCPAVYDQGHLGSCTANAIGAALEYDRLKQGLPDFIPSRLFIYYNERAMEGTISVDAGAYIRDGIKSVEKQGFCHEPIWPYVISNFDDKPPDQAYTDAKKYKAISYFRLNNSDITELKSCLAAGFPFVFGFTVYTSFFKADANRGEVPMPGPERVVGGHAVLAVGYDDASSRFIVRNSWGARRGDKGYYYMPYQYLTDTELSDDFWTIRSVTAAQLAPNN